MKPRRSIMKSSEIFRLLRCPSHRSYAVSWCNNFLFDKLLTSSDEHSRWLLGHKLLIAIKLWLFHLSCIILCAGLELAAKSSFKIASVVSSPAEQLVGEGNPEGESLVLFIPRLG